MEIFASFDSDVANAPAGFRACVNAACQYLDALLTDPIALHIDVGYGTLGGQTIASGALGESSGSFQFVNYSTAANALRSKGEPGASSLPASAPNGASLVLSNAQAKTLGFNPRSSIDGYVGFSTGANWDYDPTQAKAAPFNSYDFVGAVLHEVTEVLGRISFLDQSGQIALLDLFRYASAGSLQATTGGPSYFSIDGGATAKLAFNNYQTGDQGDLGDWATANRTNDAFNDDSFNGVLNPISATDKVVLQAIGFSETAASQALTVASAVPQLTAAAAVSELSSGVASYVKILDSGAGVSASLDALEVLAKGQYLSSIGLSGGSAITLSIAQIGGDADALKAIAGGYSLSVADSAANIQANLAMLENQFSGGKLSAATVTDNAYAAITVTPSQLTADHNVIDLLTGKFTLTVDATSSANVSISGPSGHGTVVELSGTASQYALTSSGNGTGFILTSSAGAEEISNITALSFGGTLDFVAANPGKADAITSGNITELYGAAFGREPDVPGLAFYQAYLKASPSVSLTTYATYFLSSPEYTGAHAYAHTNAGDAQFIADCYQNLLHRTPSSSETSYYQGVIASYGVGTLQAHAQVLTYFSQSPEFLGNVQITAQHPADAAHWLYLI